MDPCYTFTGLNISVSYDYNCSSVNWTVTESSTSADVTTSTSDVIPQAAVWSLVGDVALAVTLGILSLVTIVGNAMVLHAVRTEQALQSVSESFSDHECSVSAYSGGE